MQTDRLPDRETRSHPATGRIYALGLSGCGGFAAMRDRADGSRGALRELPSRASAAAAGGAPPTPGTPYQALQGTDPKGLRGSFGPPRTTSTSGGSAKLNPGVRVMARNRVPVAASRDTTWRADVSGAADDEDTIHEQGYPAGREGARSTIGLRKQATQRVSKRHRTIGLVTSKSHSGTSLWAGVATRLGHALKSDDTPPPGQEDGCGVYITRPAVVILDPHAEITRRGRSGDHL